MTKRIFVGTSPSPPHPLRLAITWLIPLAFLGIFYFFPLGSILKLSFARGEGGLAETFLATLFSPRIAKILGFTLGQAALSTLLTLLVGLPGAYLLGRYDFPGKSLLRALTAIPFVLPTLVVAAAFSTFLGPRGWVNLLLINLFGLSHPPIQFINTLGAILTAHVFYNTTIVLRMVGDFWSHLDPRLEHAARLLGADRWRTFTRVTLPILAPAILTAALLVFIFDFTSFGVILVLGGPRFATLEVEIYYQTVSLFNLPMAAMLSIVQLACTLGLTLLYSWLSSSLTRHLPLKPQQFTLRRLPTWRSRFLAGLLVIFLLALFTMPLVSLLSQAFIKTGVGGEVSLTLDYFRELGINRRESFFYVPPTRAIGISLSYALATVIFSLALGVPAALAVTRDSSSRFNRLLNAVIMLPLGTSAITLGLGFIVALARPPLDLRASPVIVPIAHTLVAFPFVVRSLVPSLRSIRPRLRHAAATLGAHPGAIIRQIDLPLIGRALIVAAAFAFTISLGEFGATALVARPEFPTIPVMIYRFISQPGALNYGQAIALSAILSLVTGLGILAIERLRIAEIGEF